MYWERGDERRIYFGARNWFYALDADHRKAHRRRSAGRAGSTCAKASRAATAHHQHRREHARRVLRRSADPRLARARSLPSAPGDIRAFDVHTGTSAGRFTRSRIRASSATTPGRRTRGSTAAAPTRGPVCRWMRSAGWCSRRRLGVLRFLRRQPARRQPVRQHDHLPEGGDRRARLALPGHQARPLGPRLPRPAHARHDHAATAGARDASRRSAKNGARLRLRSRDRQAGLPDARR